jgi:hypothetical protein
MLATDAARVTATLCTLTAPFRALAHAAVTIDAGE